MNICITSHDMVPQYICGIKRVSSHLAKKWSETYNVYFVAFSPQNNQIKEIEGIPQYHFPNPQNILADENLDYFTAFIKKNNIDIILHQHCDIVDFTELCVKVAQRKKIKLVNTLHFAPTHKNDVLKESFFIRYKLGKSPCAWIKDLILYSKYHLYAKHKNNKENSRLYHDLIKKSSRLVLLSPSYVHNIAQHLKLDSSEVSKLKSISNPIEIQQLQGNIKKKKRVLWCGRVEYGTKRVDRMLDMWSTVAPHYPEWELYIMGSGDIEYFRDIVRHRKIQNVHFTGFCNPYDYYKDASILCMTSSAEGLPMVILEAQMFGCVPIAYNSFSSLQDFITDNINGLKIRAFDKKEFARKLGWLMENENERHRIAQECCKSTAKFDINIIAKEWIDLFRSLINERT